MLALVLASVLASVPGGFMRPSDEQRNHQDTLEDPFRTPDDCKRVSGVLQYAPPGAGVRTLGALSEAPGAQNPDIPREATRFAREILNKLWMTNVSLEASTEHDRPTNPQGI